MKNKLRKIKENDYQENMGKTFFDKNGSYCSIVSRVFNMAISRTSGTLWNVTLYNAVESGENDAFPAPCSERGQVLHTVFDSSPNHVWTLGVLDLLRERLLRAGFDIRVI